MRKDLGEKPLIYPQPVLLVGTYDADGVPNLMTAAWGCVWGLKEVEINLSVDHKTSQNIRLHEAFTLSMATQDVIAAADYVGLVSGKKVILYCVLTMFEIPQLKAIIDELDSSTFIAVSDVTEIIGTHVKKSGHLEEFEADVRQAIREIK